MINLELVRFGYGYDSTAGKWYLQENGGRRFLCYALEDECRRTKVYGETCIPSGTYPLALQKVGRFHERYKARWDWHVHGMIAVHNVPDFTGILIHPGSDDDDTKGCPLTGLSLKLVGGEFVVPGGESGPAYEHLYRLVAPALARGERAVLHVSDFTGHR